MKESKKYTDVLLEGKEPTFALLSLLSPPPMFEVWDPDTAGRPRRWNKPWRRTPLHPGADNSGQGGEASPPPEDPILRMSATTEHPTVSKPQGSKENQSTLLGYMWNLKEDTV